MERHQRPPGDLGRSAINHRTAINHNSTARWTRYPRSIPFPAIASARLIREALAFE
jgi:hypothetical protein